MYIPEDFLIAYRPWDPITALVPPRSEYKLYQAPACIHSANRLIYQALACIHSANRLIYQALACIHSANGCWEQLQCLNDEPDQIII